MAGILVIVQQVSSMMFSTKLRKEYTIVYLNDKDNLSEDLFQTYSVISEMTYQEKRFLKTDVSVLRLKMGLGTRA